MKRFVVSCLLLLLFTCATGKSPLSIKDKTLIVPGKSAEGFALGENFTSNVSLLSGAVIGDDLSAVIREVIGSDFDLLYYQKNSFIIFLKEGKIVAIAGLETAERVTVDAQRLSDGAFSFLLAYGNKDLKVISDNSNSIYLYSKYGIAIFDDLSDDSIDMYIIFPAR